LEGVIRELIAFLKFSVAIGLRLNCVVCQVDELIVQVRGVQAEAFRRCAQISLLKDIDLLLVREHRSHANIELAVVYQQRLLNVFLEDERAMKTRRLSLFQVQGFGVNHIKSALVFFIKGMLS